MTKVPMLNLFRTENSVVFLALLTMFLIRDVIYHLSATLYVSVRHF